MKHPEELHSAFTDTFLSGLLLGQLHVLRGFPNVQYMPWSGGVATMPAVAW